MANTHGVFIGTSCAFWDVDSLNLVGVNNSADLDNGTFVTLGNIVNTSGVIDEYVFNVTAGSGSDYVIGTPPVGYDFDTQLYDDPRYFTNVQGKPMSVKFTYWRLH